MSADMYDALLAALRGVPRLPGAECRHHPPELFDERRPDEDDADWQYRSQAALRVCKNCTALASCDQWFTDLPRQQRPPGVIAGQLWPPTPKPVGRPRKKGNQPS